MTSNTNTSCRTSLYTTGSLQTYQQFVCEFQFNISKAGADGMSMYFGGTTAGNSETPEHNSCGLKIESYNAATRGIYLVCNGATTSSAIFDTNSGTWENIRFAYTNNTQGTFSVYRNNSSIISYNYTDLASWISGSAGNFYGLSARTGGAAANHSFRRFSLTISD